MTRATGRAAEVRTDRLVLAQAHCTLLDIAGAIALFVSARRLGKVPGDWDAWRIPLVLGAALAAAAALGPWLVPRFGVRMQRLLVVSALAAGTIGVIGAIWVVDLLALLGLQLILTAIVLAEVGLQRRALAWLWACAFVLVGVVLVYHRVVELQPRPE